MKKSGKKTDEGAIREGSAEYDEAAGVADIQIQARLISSDEIDRALATAALPPAVRKVNTFTVDIYEAIANMKAARELGKSGSIHWQRLRWALDNAINDSDWTALDDFAKAWATVKANPVNVVYAGEDYPFSLTPDMETMKRTPLTWIVVESVKQLQRDLERVPTRSEILELVNFYYEGGIDDTELSTQLTKLEWSSYIPSQGNSSGRKIYRPAPPSQERIDALRKFRLKTALGSDEAIPEDPDRITE